MTNVELINLVTTKLIQEKKESSYHLYDLVNSELPIIGSEYRVDLIRKELTKYNSIINDITLWDSIIDEITNSPNEEEGENKLNNN